MRCSRRIFVRVYTQRRAAVEIPTANDYNEGPIRLDLDGAIVHIIAASDITTLSIKIVVSDHFSCHTARIMTPGKQVQRRYS